MGPRRGSDPGVKGRAKGSPGTGMRWKHGPAFRAQLVTCKGERESSIIGASSS